MPNFKDLDALTAYLQQQLNEVLLEEGTEVIKDTMLNYIDSNVYQTYNPMEYDRRNELNNPDNIVGEIIGNGELFVKNIAEPNDSVTGDVWNDSDPTGFSRLINDGLAPDIFNSADSTWTRPAMFIEDTIADLQDSDKFEKAIRKGLSKKGIKTVIKSNIGI